MLRAHGLTLYELADLTSPGPTDLRHIATWAVDFLATPHRQLGRRGAVCPYTGHLSAYLDRFAPDIPSHVRRILVAKLA